MHDLINMYPTLQINCKVPEPSPPSDLHVSLAQPQLAKAEYNW